MIDSRLVERLQASNRILVVCGAGVSTASGIPDFRGPGGVWTRRRPVYYAELLASEAAYVVSRFDLVSIQISRWRLHAFGGSRSLREDCLSLSPEFSCV